VTTDKELYMNADPRALAQLLEESQDLQADALRPTHEALDELVERSHSSHDEDTASNVRFHEEHKAGLRSSFGGATLLGAAGGAALVGVLASAAGASSSKDVQVLQTAASIENLAVATYKTALTLPYIGGATANPVVTKFAQVTMGQHVQHADAFNSAIKSLGGKAQNKPDPAFVPVVNKAVMKLSGATDAQGTMGVVALALELENIAAETYVKDTTLVKSTSNKALFASIMGIEAQHVAVLLAVQALLNANAAQLISLSEPATVEALPAAAGSVGFPNAFYKTNSAAPAKQGAVK
jgi:Ferritin-like domain